MRPTRILMAGLLLTSTVGAASQEAVSDGHFAEVNGARIYYEEKGSGEPLILLHQFLGTTSSWQAYADDWAARYRVVSWDMRGHGRSTNPGSSDDFVIAEAARDLLELMDHLHIDRAKAIGASGGGAALLHAATMAPDRFEALVFVGVPAYRSTSFRRNVESASFRDNPEVLSQLAKAHGQSQAERLLRQFRRFATLHGDGITPDLLATVSARTLIVGGDNDPYLPVSQAVDTASAIPGARLWIVPNGGHLPHLVQENRDDFVRRVSEFLEGKWADDPR